MHLLTWAAELLLLAAGILLLLRSATRRRKRLFAELAAIAYIVLIAAVANITGATCILFPELGALAHDVFGRPDGRWARSPILLMLTPVATAVIGILIARHLSYGLASIMLSVGCGLLVIRVLKSPVAPAISAGLLPLVLGVTSWWYPLAILFGTAVLAGLSMLRAMSLRAPLDRMADHAPAAPGLLRDHVSLRDYVWIPSFGLFLLAAYAAEGMTGWRFLLYPPLVVVGFEMLAHTDHCPWAADPLKLPLICGIAAAAGMAFFALFGAGPLAAAAGMASGIIVLRLFDLHIPPALAVGLLPLAIQQVTPWYPVAVLLGTLILTLSFMLHQHLVAMIDDFLPGHFNASLAVSE